MNSALVDPRSAEKFFGSTRSNITAQLDAYSARVVEADGDEPREVHVLEELPAYSEVLHRHKDFVVIGHREDEGRRAWLVEDPNCEPDGIARRKAILETANNRWKLQPARLSCAPELLDLVRENAGRHEAESPREKLGIGQSDYQREFADLGQLALARNASDIHIRLKRGQGTVLLRIHGRLVKVADYSANYVLELARTIYNVEVERGSTKDSFNPNARQDGVISACYPEGGRVRFRYSGLPLAPDGFGIALRVIPQERRGKRWDAIEAGYSPDQADQIWRAVRRASGMVLFVGVTGSGKSTSMAGFLSQLGREHPDKLIRTVEDPVEQVIEEADQTASIGSFVETLRQIVRSDPDTLMIGEIRDLETATVAIQAVMTGHPTLSTLHVNSAPAAYDRLVGLGVPRQDIASVNLISAVVFQRLVRKLCPHCKVPYTQYAYENPDSDVVARLRATYKEEELRKICFSSPHGCAHCGGHSVAGRTLCAEVFVPDREILKAVSANDSIAVWERWRSLIRDDRPDVMQGRTANEHARWKMLEGLVSPQDVEDQFGLIDSPVSDVTGRSTQG